jgi:CheY-like chemotaxis protein
MSPGILLVEDSRHDILLAERACARAKVKAPLQIVMDGELAIRYLSGDEPFNDRERYPLPSLVLLDLNLPRRNGHEILTWLRQRPELAKETLPVVILSTSDEVQDREMAARAGASRYLVKPLYPEILEEILRDFGLQDLCEP